MSYKTKTKILFEEWRNAVPEYRKNFIYDGIVNEDLFEKANPKVLFLMKEANDPSIEADWNLAESFNREVKNNFGWRLAEWAWGILNNFSQLENATKEDLHSALKGVAVANIKKSSGGASADYEVIQKHLIKNKNFLLKQISLIDPDIILGGLGTTSLWDLLFEKLSFIQSGYDIKIARFNKYKLIDFYHPSYRVPRAMSYSLLMNIIKSSAFKKL